MIRKVGDEFKLIFIIVKKNLSRQVIKAVKKGGAEGGTVMQGRGTSKKDGGSVFGVKVEPEKAVILCLVPDSKVESVITKVRESANLNKPGTGIAFVVNSKSICGIAHLLNKDF